LNTLDSQSINNDPDDILDISIESWSPPVAEQQPPSPEPAPPEAWPAASNGEGTSQPDITPSPPVTLDGRVDPGITGPEPAQGYAEPSPTTSSEEWATDDGPHWFGLMLREVVETVGLAVIIFLIIRIGIQNYRIEGQSMEPNFHDGEYLIVNKLAYRLGDYERGDVIVFHYPNDPSKDYIKRIIGLPGDTVEIRGGQLYVNNVQIDEPYPHRPNVRDEPPAVVEADHLYVMGDNRPASSDTRSWGQLDESFVVGQAWVAIWPFDEAGIVAHQPIEVGSVMAQGP